VTIKIRKPNLKRLASLSALGAGALGAATGSAEASTIVYSGIVDETVGLTLGSGGKATIAGPNGVAGIIRVFSAFFPSASSSAGDYERRARITSNPGAHGTGFRVRASRFLAVSAVAPGGRFGKPPASRSIAFGTVAFSGCVTSGRSRCNTGHISDFNATDRYLIFKFAGGDLSHPIYGWAQLSVILPGGDHNGFTYGPDVTLIDYAYDTSGVQIPAGDTGTPEPSTFALTGLAALALGARGLRNWRAARKAA